MHKQRSGLQTLLSNENRPKKDSTKSWEKNDHNHTQMIGLIMNSRFGKNACGFVKGIEISKLSVGRSQPLRRTDDPKKKQKRNQKQRNKKKKKSAIRQLAAPEAQFATVCGGSPTVAGGLGDVTDPRWAPALGRAGRGSGAAQHLWVGGGDLRKQHKGDGPGSSGEP